MVDAIMNIIRVKNHALKPAMAGRCTAERDQVLSLIE
jgi:hypothetical protein